jgi:hypothetical protein
MGNEFETPPVDWRLTYRLGYGALALAPALLLISSLFSAVAAGVSQEALGMTAELLYVHIGVQFLVLLVFGHLMMTNPSVESAERWFWGAAFLVGAPVATLAYWYIHVWNAEAAKPTRARVSKVPTAR